MFKIASLSARRLGRSPSFPVNVRPTRADAAVAHSIARSTAPAPEQVARALTWGADEKLLLVLTAVGWLGSRGCGVPLRRAGNHALPVTVTASLLPDDLKLVFDQTRPDRRTVIGHMHGVPLSGKRKMRFPQATRCTWTGTGGQRVAGWSPAGDPRDCGRAVAHSHCDPGAFGERCRCRLRTRGDSRTGPPALDRLLERNFKGG